MERHTEGYDMERGKAEGILPLSWQTDTSLGSWRYDRAICAIALEIPGDGKVTIKSLATGSENWRGKIGSVRLVGSGWWNKLKFTRDEAGLPFPCPKSLMAGLPLH